MNIKTNSKKEHEELESEKRSKHRREFTIF